MRRRWNNRRSRAVLLRIETKGKEKKMAKSNSAGWDWHGTYTAAVEQLPDRLSKMQLVFAFWQFAEYGVEPEFIVHHVDGGMEYASPKCPKFALQAIFEANRVNLLNSVKAHINGKKGAEHGDRGGRPRDGETKDDAYIRRNGIDAFVTARTREGISQEDIDAAVARADAKAKDPTDPYDFEYEPTQVPDECWDYTEEERYVPPFPSALDIDISQDLA